MTNKKQDFILLNYKTYKFPNEEYRFFCEKILFSNNSSFLGKRNLKKDFSPIFAIKKEFSYNVLESKVVQTIDSYNSKMQFEISGKDKIDVSNLIKKIYKDYSFFKDKRGG